MIKSSLFNNLFEGGGSNRGSKYQDRVNADIDNPKKDPKTVKPRQGNQVEDLDQAYLDQKATYGNLYTVDKTSLQALQDELNTLPFRLSESASRSLLIAIKNIIFNAEYPKIQTLVTSNPGFQELAAILDYSGPITLDPTSDVIKQLQDTPKYALDSNNADNGGNSYAALVALVIPFIDPNILTKAVYDHPNVKETLKAYSAQYTGSLITKLDWDGELPDFSNFEHIAEPLAKQFLGLVKTVVTGTQQSKLPPRLLKLAKRGVAEANTAFQKSLSGNIASNKHKNNIVRNIYYSMITRTLPQNADFFELDDQSTESGTKKLFDNPNAANRPQILTDKAQTLIAARIISVERNPFLYKGTLGQNSKTQLAFDYAKRVAFKKSKHAEVNAKTTDVVAKLFDGAIQLVPGMANHMQKLEQLLETYFKSIPDSTPESTSTVTESVEGIEDRSNKLKQELDAFAEEGLVLLQQSLSNDTLNKIFATLSKNEAFASLRLDPTTAVTHYLEPFKEALISRFAIIQSITAEDLKQIFTIGNAITDFLADGMNKKTILSHLDSFNSYVKTKASGGDDEGFKFIHKAAEIPVLIQEAKKKLKKTKSNLDKVPKNTTQLAASQYKAIHDARKKILDTKHLLQRLPEKAEALLVHIKNSINSLSPSALNALVSGDLEENEKQEVDTFFSSLVNTLYDAYFNESAFGLLTESDVEPNVVKEYIVSDLKEKATNGTLIASGSLRSYVDYYEGLNEDFLNFINLAASIKDTHKGISVDASGNISFNYDLETTSPRNAFFTKFFFGDLTSRVSAEPVVTLAAHRTILKRLQDPAKEVLTSVTLEDILTPEILKTQPTLSAKLGLFFDSLQKTASSGIDQAVAQIDRDILDLAAGSYIPLVTSAPESTNAYSSYYIPGVIDKDYEATITTLGSNALRMLAKVPGSDTVSKEFFSNICISGTLGGEFIVIALQNALDIISTAINIDIARQTFYGSDTQIQAVNGLIRKYQKIGATEAITDLKQAKDIADSYVQSLTKATERQKKLPDGTTVSVPGTGIQGTHVLSGSDNHVDNPLLLAILRRFNDTIKADSWATMALEYSQKVKAEKDSGTYHSSDINVVVSKIGIAYTRIGLFTEEATASDNITEGVEEPAKQITPLFVQGEKGIKFNPSSMKSLKTDLEKRVYGSEQVQLNKGQRQGQNYKQVTSYKDLFAKSKSAMHSLSEVIGAYLISSGQKSLAIDLVKDIKSMEHNFTVLASPSRTTGEKQEDPNGLSASTGTGFFDIISDPNTLGVSNIPTQVKLMNTLKMLHVNEPSEVFNSLFVELPNPKSEAFQIKLQANFARIPGATALYQLLASGKDLETIKREVTDVLESVNQMSPQLRVDFNALADVRDLESEQFTDVPEDAREYLKKIYSNPIFPATLMQYKPEYMKRYATLLDTQLYAELDKETAAVVKKEAVKLSQLCTPKLRQEIVKEVQAGHIVNQITKAQVKTLADPASLHESKVYTASLLMEAAEAINNMPVKIIASVLQRRGITANQGQLVTSDGTPYGFNDFGSMYWMLFATNNAVSQNAAIVNRLFKSKDELEFRVAGQKYEYARVIDFTRLKQLVDTYFKPEELTSEPTNESSKSEETK